MAARVPGALARSGKKRAVFAFANKREPELFPSREAGRTAPCLSFPPPPSSAAARRRHIPRRPLRAPGGERGREARGPRGAVREVQEGMQQGSAPAKPLLQPGSCRTREQQVAEDTESSAPHLRSPGRGGRSSGATVPLLGASPLGLCLLFTR